MTVLCARMTARSWSRLWEEHVKTVGQYLPMEVMARALLSDRLLCDSLKLKWYREQMRPKADLGAIWAPKKPQGAPGA